MIRYVQRETYPRASVESSMEVRLNNERYDRHHGCCYPRCNDEFVRELEAESLLRQWKAEANESVHSDEHKRHYGDLTGDGGQESADLAQGTPLPLVGVLDVNASVVDVDARDDYEVDPHEKIGAAKAEDESGTYPRDVL